MATNTISNQAKSAREREGRPEQTGFRVSLGENARGLLILGGASAALVAIAYGAMLALTAPDGWASRVTHAAVTADADTAIFTVWPGE